MNEPRSAPERVQVDNVIIRFAGDSGDGMQLTGTRFSETSALAGNDVATLPDFPAEIRAPAGSLAGVSGFQLQFASEDVFTAGDRPDVLVAMNPAALARNVGELEPGATLIVDHDAFSAKNLARAGFESNPLDDGSLERFVVHNVPITRLTVGALDEIDELSSRDKEQSRNFFALGLSFWMFGRSTEPTLRWIEQRFGAGSVLARANTLALRKGYEFGITAELGPIYEVRPAPRAQPGTYRSITGNLALAYGLAAAGQLAERPLVLASYPITPASDILHTLSGLKHFGVRTVQAEDEIAAVCMAIGASYGGAIGLTTSSGPGIALKSEAISLAVSTELPLVVIDVQRAGPSTGMPTKVEQADLMQAIYGRHGEAPVVVLAPATPSECFDVAIEAVRIATKYMTPVMVLSDAYLANGSEPWRVPDVSQLPSIAVPGAVADGDQPFQPFSRDPETLARPWAVPGTRGLEHRIGGLEKADGSGNISYDPANHEHMSRLRAEKIARVAFDVAPLAVEGDVDAELLVLGWGSTYGPIRAAVERARSEGVRVAQAHLRTLYPFPANTEAVLRRYPRILIPEKNLGQLSRLVRDAWLIDVVSYARITGQPFKAAEIHDQIVALTRHA